MSGEVARVPTSASEHDKQWTVETALDHVLGIIASNDKRYEQRFEASQKALDAALTAQKEATVAAFAAQEKAINAALASAERAVLKAELATEKRFEGVNEFRAALDQQQRTLIPRSEVDVLIRGLEEKIAQLTKQADAIAAERKGGQATWAYIAGGVGVLIALATLVLRYASP